MHAERRGYSTNRYYYRSVRDGKKVSKEYIGSNSSELANFQFRLSRLKTADSQAQVALLDLERQGAVELNAALSRLEEILSRSKILSDLMARSRIAFQLPRLKLRNLLADSVDQTTMTTTNTPKESLPGLHEFRRLCRNAAKGDPQAEMELQRLTQSCPDLLREACDLVKLAATILLDSMKQANSTTRYTLAETLLTNSESTRQALGHHPLGTLMADVLVIAWMDTLRCQIAAMRQNQSVSQQKFWESAKERACRRFQKLQDQAMRMLRLQDTDLSKHKPSVSNASHPQSSV